MPNRPEDRVRCSFCGKSQEQVKKLIAGNNNVFICDECIDLCAEILEEEMDENDEVDLGAVSYTHLEAKESAVIQGTILVDHYKKNPELLDQNGDGVVSYVLLEGESSHQDAVIRTEWAIRTLKENGVPAVSYTHLDR